MKFILLLIFSTSSVANSLSKFDVTHNMTNETYVTWEQASDVQKACDKESKKRGLGGFTASVEACSFWGVRGTMKVCHIITEKSTNLDTIGHEIRHCFQGAFHK